MIRSASSLIVGGACTLVCSCAHIEPEPKAQPTSTEQDVSEPPAVTDRAEPTPERATTPEPRTEPAWVDAFPALRIDHASGRIEMEGYISPWIFDRDGQKRYYLEQFVCTPNTKEHESLVVTEARPSHLHASLLLLGLEPGSPGRWDGQGTAFGASGPSVRVRFRYVDATGAPRTVHPVAWTMHEDSAEPMIEREWIFAGSTTLSNAGRTLYEADSAGTVIGLASFGGEVLSWPEYIHDVEATGHLAWYARTAAMPPAETPVTILIEAVR